MLINDTPSEMLISDTPSEMLIRICRKMKIIMAVPSQHGLLHYISTLTMQNKY